jgi:SAM-dependent methyltransferase
MRLTIDDMNWLRARLLPMPRELSGRQLRALEETLATFLGDEPSRFAESWYRTAGAASYAGTEAAAAYLGGYGARSIIEYSEALLSLFFAAQEVPDNLRVVDFGCGPGPGVFALFDIYDGLVERFGQAPSLTYTGYDREESMLELARENWARLTGALRADATCTFETFREDTQFSGDLLIVANVLNEGEGNDDTESAAARFLHFDFSHVIFIEPATQSASRGLCSAASRATLPWRHIGPCPSAGTACNQWSFREANKRIYNFERACLGVISPAAFHVRYSLALMSKSLAPRPLMEGESVIVGRPLNSRVATCHLGVPGVRVLQPNGAPWATVLANGLLVKAYP